MKQLCKLSDNVWNYTVSNNSMSDLDKIEFENHMLTCTECSNMYTMIMSWKMDTPTENPYLAQKILDRITENDSTYSHASNLVIRWAFSFAIVIGVALGVFVQTALNDNSANAQIVENDHQSKIESYSSEIHYDQLKIKETQQLLTDAR